MRDRISTITICTIAEELGIKPNDIYAVNLKN
jgi:hypothetical protein